MESVLDMLIVWALPLIGFLYLVVRMLFKKKYFILIGFVTSFISAYIVTTVTESWVFFFPVYNLVICFVICYGIGYVLQVRADKKHKKDR